MCIKNPERFVQLGCGWVLREVSVDNLKVTVEFIEKNYEYFSREGLRYACEKMPDSVRAYVMNDGKGSVEKPSVLKSDGVTQPKKRRKV